MDQAEDTESQVAFGLLGSRGSTCHRIQRGHEQFTKKMYSAKKL